MMADRTPLPLCSSGRCSHFFTVWSRAGLSFGLCCTVLLTSCSLLNCLAHPRPATGVIWGLHLLHPAVGCGLHIGPALVVIWALLPCCHLHLGLSPWRQGDLPGHPGGCGPYRQSADRPSFWDSLEFLVVFCGCQAL